MTDPIRAENDRKDLLITKLKAEVKTERQLQEIEDMIFDIRIFFVRNSEQYKTN